MSSNLSPEEEVKKAFRRQHRGFTCTRIITALLAIALGVVFLVWSDVSGDILCTILGICMVAAGAGCLVWFLIQGILYGGLSLILGITLLLAGSLFLVKPELVQNLLMVIFGAVIIVDGCSMLVNSIECARFHLPAWWVMTLLSIVVIVLGGVVMMMDFSAVMQFAGIALIVDGVSKMIITCAFNHRILEAKRQIESIRRNIVIDAD